MSYNLGEMVDRMTSMDDVIRSYGFRWVHGGGRKPWSVRFNHQDGRSIDLRASEWTLYDANDNETASSSLPNTIQHYLKGF